MDAREKAKELLRGTELTGKERRCLDKLLTANRNSEYPYFVGPIIERIEKRLVDLQSKTLFCQLCGRHRLPGDDDMDPDDCGGISMCAACRADTNSQIGQGRRWSECQFCEDHLLLEFFEEQQAAEYGMCKACQERLEKLDLLVECDSCHGFVHQMHTSSVCTFPGSRYQPPEHADICNTCNYRAEAAAEDGR